MKYIPAATAHPEIVATSTGEYFDRHLYTLEGQAGLWRRIHRKARSINPTNEKATVGHVVDANLLAEFVPCDDLHRSLGILAGMSFVAAEQLSPCRAQFAPTCRYPQRPRMLRRLIQVGRE